MKNAELHNWTKDDLILAYYHALCGDGGLQVESATSMAEFVIGSTRRSLEMQAANFRYLLQIDGYQLEHCSNEQMEIVVMMKNIDRTELRNVCNSIILKSNHVMQRKNKKLESREEFKERMKTESEQKLQKELERHAQFGRPNLKFLRRRE